MKIIIDIPQGLKIDFENENWTALTCAEMKEALMHGTQLPKGNWINKKCRDGGHLPCCSACGESSGTYYEYNYCPNCGAKMEAEDANNIN